MIENHVILSSDDAIVLDLSVLITI